MATQFRDAFRNEVDKREDGLLVVTIVWFIAEPPPRYLIAQGQDLEIERVRASAHAQVGHVPGSTYRQIHVLRKAAVYTCTSRDLFELLLREFSELFIFRILRILCFHIMRLLV